MGWRDRYMQPFWNMDHLPYPMTFRTPMPLSIAANAVASPWTHHHYRYAVTSWHRDYWWDDEFLQLMATEVDERVAMVPEAYPSFQFLPVGGSSQWARNAGMNSLTWRDARAYVDDWMFVKSDERYQEVADRMRDFREKTRRYWLHSDGRDHSTWMSPSTVHPNATELRNWTVAQQFFPNMTQFHELQALKVEPDPHGMFSNKGTIPLPNQMIGAFPSSVIV